MDKKLSKPKRFNAKNIDAVPNQSGIYVFKNPNNEIQYVGSAGAGRLRERLREHLNNRDIPNATLFQFRKTTSEKMARDLEKEYISRLRPRYNKQLND